MDIVNQFRCRMTRTVDQDFGNEFERKFHIFVGGQHLN
jgi:hypothetical protein